MFESTHWYACGADRRSGGRSVYGHVITKFSRMGSLPHFLSHGAPQARFARQSSAITHGAPLRAARTAALLKIYIGNSEITINLQE